ncbi:GNVR domain-containing protein [Sphingomonas sp.]|uniref:GumC family protein n=1 Tax=Sphingomonas sp. TaxID=28214 RepID=UPI0025CF4F26|nr:GNVR domain-containing protein [Sphingomonas sp.]
MVKDKAPFAQSGLAPEWRKAVSFEPSILWMILQRRARTAGIVAAVVAIAVMGFYATLKPTYSATAQIAVNTQRANVVDARTEALTEDQPTTFAVDTQVEVLRSRDLARSVVNVLHLERDPEFVKPSLIGSPAAAQAATDALINKVKVSRSGNAFAINITAESHDSETAAKIANTVVGQYLGGQMAFKTGTTQSATRMLGSRLTELRGQVSQAETAVQQYRNQHGLLNSSKDETSTQMELDRIGGQLATAQADLAEKRASASTARTQEQGASSGQDVSQALTSDVIVQLRRQRADIGANVAQLQQRYADKYPALVEARSQLADIDREINAEVARIISGMQGSASASAGRVASLQGTVNQTRAQLAANGAAGVKLAELERNAEAVRTLYETYLARYRQTSTQEGLETSDARVVSNAVAPPRPSEPKLSIFLIIALTAALGAAAAAVAIRELLDQTLRTPDAIKESIGLTTLASVPSFKSALGAASLRGKTPRELVLDYPFSAFTESLRMLRTGISTDNSDAKVVVITSTLPGEGKTTVSECLAHVAAIGGERAILIQCDTRRDVGGLAASRPEAGLLEVLSGDVPLASALQIDDRSGLFVLPLSNQPLRPSDELGGTNMDALLVELRREFDLIVIDTAPVLAIAETRRLAIKGDAVCLLVRWGKTPSNAANTAAQLLRDAGAPLVGAALSHVDLDKQPQWSRNDPSAYFHSMTAYYA